ncbi:MAG: Outer rane receptor protein involved in Fe transport [Segetibacter sp.]|nr:Outer rane receptor protein involved in Fe transport [Segetibacter sp.]
MLFILVANLSSAQSIKGTVWSLTQPVQSVTVTLTGEDKKIQSVSTDPAGSFLFSNVKPGKYNLKASHISYEVIDTVIILKDSIKISLTFMPKSTQLDSVVINSPKNLSEIKIDRIVYRVDGVSLYRNKSVTDILKNIPRLNVTRNSIEIRGSGPAAVMIDDHLIYLSNRDLLEYLSIYKDNIQNIEIITNPSAKYDAQGAALINIVTKRHKVPGLFGYVESALTKNSYWESDENLSLNYRNRNFSIAGSVSNSFGAYKESVKSSTDFFNNSLTDYNDASKNKNNINNNRITLVTEILLNAKSKIYGSYSLVTNSGKTDQHHFLDYTKETRLDSIGLTSGSSTNRGSTNLFNTSYNVLFGGNKNTLDLSFDYVTKTNKQNFYTSTYNYFNDLVSSTGSKYDLFSAANIPKDVLSTKFDFRFPEIFFKYNMEAGGKYTAFNNDSKTDYDQLINNKSIFEDIATKDTFTYKEQNVAAYISLDRSYTKLSVKFGLRYEKTITKGISTNSLYKNNLNNFFPSVFFQYKISDANSANISYTRRIIRPSLFDVNPFRFYSSIFSYYVGNPTLSPTLQDNFTFNYNLKGQYLFSAFYNIAYKPVITFPNAIGNVLENSKRNNGKLQNYGFNFDASANIIKPLQSNFSLSISSYVLRTDFIYEFDKKPINISLSTTQSLEVSKTLSADLNFSATLPGGGNNISKRKGYSSLDIGMNKLLFKNKLILTLAAQDILKTSSQGGTTTTNEFLSKNENYYDFRQLMLTIRYKFGKELKATKRKANSQDINRM